MSGPGRQHVWPFSTAAALVAAPVLLLVLLALFALLGRTGRWHLEGSEGTVLLGIALLSLTPVFLAILDSVADRGGVVEYKGIKLSFASRVAASPSSVSVPVNIGVPGEPLVDSGTTQILDSLARAVNTESVVLDLAEGDAWWETRLLVLLAGATRLGQPGAIVFVGHDGGRPESFQGWGRPADLLRALLRVDRRYQESYQRAKAAGSLWALAEPVAENVPVPAPPPWAQGLGTQYDWMAFKAQSGLKNELAEEQALAADLGSTVEMVERPKGIGLTRLEEIFRPVLVRDSIDEDATAEQQLEGFLKGGAPYVAVTRQGRFQRLIGRVDGLNGIVRSLAEQLGG